MKKYWLMVRMTDEVQRRTGVDPDPFPKVLVDVLTVKVFDLWPFVEDVERHKMLQFGLIFGAYVKFDDIEPEKVEDYVQQICEEGEEGSQQARFSADGFASERSDVRPYRQRWSVAEEEGRGDGCCSEVQADDSVSYSQGNLKSSPDLDMPRKQSGFKEESPNHFVDRVERMRGRIEGPLFNQVMELRAGVSPISSPEVPDTSLGEGEDERPSSDTPLDASLNALESAIEGLHSDLVELTKSIKQ